MSTSISATKNSPDKYQLTVSDWPVTALAPRP